MQPRQRDAGLACQKWQFRPPVRKTWHRVAFHVERVLKVRSISARRCAGYIVQVSCHPTYNATSTNISHLLSSTGAHAHGPLWASDGELSLAADRSFVPDHASPKQGKRIAAAKPMTRDESPRRAPAHRPHPHPSISTHTRTKAVASMSLPFNQPRYDHHTLSETPVPLAQTASESTHTSTHTHSLPAPDPHASLHHRISPRTQRP